MFTEGYCGSESIILLVFSGGTFLRTLVFKGSLARKMQEIPHIENGLLHNVCERLRTVDVYCG